MEPKRFAKVEVYFLDEHQGWDTVLVEIPEEIAKTASQDAFLKWVYSADGEAFRESWASDTTAVFVMSWRDDLRAQDHPDLYNDDVLYGRDKTGLWTCFERESAAAVFDVWEQDIRTVSVNSIDLVLYTRAEAEEHLRRLVVEFTHPSTLNITELNAEIATLRGALNGDG